jgi:hypothetical protein
MALTLQASVGLNGKNKAADVRMIKARLVELGFDWLTADDQVGPTTINAIRLFQGMINSVNTLGHQLNDGRVDVNGTAIVWLRAANAPRWVRMAAAGEGFVNFEVQDTGDHHDFGSSWLDDLLRAAGQQYQAQWRATHPTAALLTINDTSMPQGGDTPAHCGHETGMACDLRLPRKDGKAGGITTPSSAYDRDAMRAQLLALRAQPLIDRIFLIDPVLNQEGLCRPLAGHQNHVHLEIKAPPRQP